MSVKGLGRLFSRFIPSDSSIKIRKGPLKGKKWIAGAGAGEGKGLSVVFNLSEANQLKLASELTRPDSICFDLGANVGFYTLLFSHLSKCVVAFEPLPRNIRYLSKVLELNKVRNTVIVPFAVSDSTGFASFQEGDNCALGKLDDRGTQPVATISCDEFISEYGIVPDLIKIDVEGAELSVLKGAQSLLSERKPKILLSTHGEYLKTKCINFLKEIGYSQFAPLSAETIESAADFAVM